jgi:hypothetical protein
MASERDRINIVADLLKNQQRIPSAAEMVVPQPEANVRLEPLALPVHTGRLVDPLGNAAFLQSIGKLLERLLVPLVLRKALPDFPADVDAVQSSPALIKLRRLIGASKSFGSSTSDTGRDRFLAQAGL